MTLLNFLKENLFLRDRRYTSYFNRLVKHLKTIDNEVDLGIILEDDRLLEIEIRDEVFSFGFNEVYFAEEIKLPIVTYNNLEYRLFFKEGFDGTNWLTMSLI